MLGFSPIAGAAIAAGSSANNGTILLAATEAKDTALFNLGIDVYVTLVATEASDTASFVTELVGNTYLLTTDNPDTALFVIQNINIDLSATEAPDTAYFLATMTGTIAMAAVETPDSYSQNAYILWLTPDQPDDPTIWVPKNDPAPYLTTVI
jgi:hypothetical protein